MNEPAPQMDIRMPVMDGIEAPALSLRDDAMVMLRHDDGRPPTIHDCLP
jgi:CheY-like chemotaxis protein